MRQRHLETWLSRARESDPDGVPMAAHIERELRGFSSCGILAHGFARARCGGCGHDFLVAFSCKGRGICPACTTRPVFASERREVLGQGDEDESGCADERIRYTLVKPRPHGATSLALTPLELLDRLAALIPPPWRHPHRYHGLFAPHSPLRPAVTACARKGVAGPAQPGAAGEERALPERLAILPAQPTPPASSARRAAACTWVRLLARIYEVLPLLSSRPSGCTSRRARRAAPARAAAISGG